jgi:hypothetical protein
LLSSKQERGAAGELDDVERDAEDAFEEGGLGDLGGGAGGGQAACFEQDEAGAPAGGEIPIVGDGNDQVALEGELAQGGEEFDLVADVEEGSGLIEEEDAGLLGEGAGDEDALFFAAREIAEVAVAEVGAVHGGEGLVDLGPVFGAFKPGVHVGGAAHHDDLFDAVAEGEFEGGFDEGDLAGDGAAGEAGERYFAEVYGAAGDWLEAGEGAEESGLAGAVGAEDDGEFAGGEVE